MSSLAKSSHLALQLCCPHTAGLQLGSKTPLFYILVGVIYAAELSSCRARMGLHPRLLICSAFALLSLPLCAPDHLSIGGKTQAPELLLGYVSKDLAFFW